MTYPRRSRGRGIVIVDAMVGIALSALFVSLIAYSTMSARQIRDRAAQKQSLASSFLAHEADFAGLMPGESRSRSYTDASNILEISAQARWYGNDMIETDMSASSSGRAISFESFRSRSGALGDDFAGTPFCSADHGEIASITPIILPIDASLPLTDIAVRDGVAYVSADSAHSSDPDLLVFDISDPKKPALMSVIDTGPGIRAIAIAGKYIYAAAASTAAQLHVIQLASLAAPTLLAKYKLPLPEASTSPPSGTAVFYDAGGVYLGTDKWDGQELSVIDAHDASKPMKTSGYETGSRVNAIYVRQGTAYVAASDQYQLRILDVHGGSPILLHSLDPSGWQRQQGQAVVSFEDDVGFGRTAGGFDIQTDKELFMWPNGTTSPLEENIPGGIYGLVMGRSNILAITHGTDKELAIFSRDLSSSTARYYPLPVLPQAITCDLDRVYILAKTAPVIYEIAFSA
jgi:hypothetical protein